MSLGACAEIVRRGDPDRFLAAMAAPRWAREALFPLYAFNVEVARAPWATGEPAIAEMRLQWWRDALADIAAGAPARRHEVAAPLARALDPSGAELLDRLVRARLRDARRAPFGGQPDLDAYLDDTAGTLAWASARALGVRSGEAGIRDVAWAGGLANWLLAVPRLEASGLRPLPDGRPEAVRALAGRGLARLAAATPREADPALLATWRARALLRQAARDPRAVREGRLAQSEFARRAGLLRRSLLAWSGPRAR